MGAIAQGVCSCDEETWEWALYHAIISSRSDVVLREPALGKHLLIAPAHLLISMRSHMPRLRSYDHHHVSDRSYLCNSPRTAYGVLYNQGCPLTAHWHDTLPAPLASQHPRLLRQVSVSARCDTWRGRQGLAASDNLCPALPALAFDGGAATQLGAPAAAAAAATAGGTARRRRAEPASAR